MIIFRKILDKYWFNWIFLFLVLIVYLFLTLLNPLWGKQVGLYFLKTLVKILPIIFLVYFLIFVFNLLIDKDFLKNFFEKWSRFKKLFFSIIGGILSSWPVYLWYPLLKNLKDKGLTYGHIAAFIYARAIKLPLLVMMISFFGIKYTIVFNLVIFVLAFVVWIVMDILMEYSTEEIEK